MESLDKQKIPPFKVEDRLKAIGDQVTMKVYVGQNDSIIKTGIIVNIYDKGKYNMLLCKFKSKKGNNCYYSCTTQMKDSYVLYS